MNHISDEDMPLPMEAANRIYLEILRDGDMANEEFAECWRQTVQAALIYTASRTMEWIRKPPADESRTGKHNAFIIDLIVLSRIFIKHGWPTTWAEELFLGNKDIDTSLYTKEDLSASQRRKVGDFAGYIVFMVSLNTR